MCNFYIIACSLATIHVQTWAKKGGFCWKGASIGESTVFKPDGLMKCNRIPPFLQQSCDGGELYYLVWLPCTREN